MSASAYKFVHTDTEKNLSQVLLRLHAVRDNAGNSKYLRRKEWFKSTFPGSKELMSVFIARCKRAVEYGELENMEANDLLPHRLMTVISEEVKKEVLMKKEDPDLDTIVKVLKRHEAKLNQDKRKKELGSNQVVNVSYKSDVKKDPRVTPETPEWKKPLARKLECWICAGEHMKFDCPTKGDVGLCNFCSKPGHVEQVCLGKKKKLFQDKASCPPCGTSEVPVKPKGPRGVGRGRGPGPPENQTSFMVYIDITGDEVTGPENKKLADNKGEVARKSLSGETEAVQSSVFCESLSGKVLLVPPRVTSPDGIQDMFYKVPGYPSRKLKPSCSKRGKMTTGTSEFCDFPESSSASRDETEMVDTRSRKRKADGQDIAPNHLPLSSSAPRSAPSGAKASNIEEKESQGSTNKENDRKVGEKSKVHVSFSQFEKRSKRFRGKHGRLSVVHFENKEKKAGGGPMDEQDKVFEKVFQKKMSKFKETLQGPPVPAEEEKTPSHQYMVAGKNECHILLKKLWPSIPKKLEKVENPKKRHKGDSLLISTEATEAEETMLEFERAVEHKRLQMENQRLTDMNELCGIMKSYRHNELLTEKEYNNVFEECENMSSAEWENQIKQDTSDLFKDSDVFLNDCRMDVRYEVLKFEEQAKSTESFLSEIEREEPVNIFLGGSEHSTSSDENVAEAFKAIENNEKVRDEAESCLDRFLDGPQLDSDGVDGHEILPSLVGHEKVAVDMEEGVILPIMNKPVPQPVCRASNPSSTFYERGKQSLG